MRLNFGCGDKKLDGYLNIDISKECRPDFVCDVRNIPYPDGWMEVERIEADNLIEHLTPDEAIAVLNEWHRILRNGGTVFIRTPLARPEEPYFDAAFGDPTHRSFYTIRTFDYWNKADRNRRWRNFGKDYGIKPFSSVAKEVKGVFLEVTMVK